jgi:hypothetical protein
MECLSDAKKLNHLHVDAQLSERAETGATQIDAVRYVLSNAQALDGTFWSEISRSSNGADFGIELQADGTRFIAQV